MEDIGPVHFTADDRKTLGNVRDSNIKLETKLDRAVQDIAEMVRSFASKADHNELERRILKLEETNSWVVKTVFGIIITAVVATAFALGK